MAEKCQGEKMTIGGIFLGVLIAVIIVFLIIAFAIIRSRMKNNRIKLECKKLDFLQEYSQKLTAYVAYLNLQSPEPPNVMRWEIYTSLMRDTSKMRDVMGEDKITLWVQRIESTISSDLVLGGEIDQIRRDLRSIFTAIQIIHGHIEEKVHRLEGTSPNFAARKQGSSIPYVIASSVIACIKNLSLKTHLAIIAVIALLVYIFCFTEDPFMSFCAIFQGFANIFTVLCA